MAVEACKILLQSGHLITWYLIGEGSERKELEKQIENLGIQENFILVGADTNPYRYLARAAIYVQTSLFEGLGLTVIEAALLCKPIVSTNFPSVQGILEDEKTGLIVSMNPNDNATNIERLINDKDLNAKLVQNLSLQESKSKDLTLSQIELILTN
jgi:glycosyltransferase involved in cell wall biosynthesis